MRTSTDSRIVYLDECPVCHQAVLDPFVRGSVQFYKHRRGKRHADCHFVIDVDPIGDNHRTLRIPDGVEYDEILARVLDEPDRWERMFQGAFVTARSRMRGQER